MKAKDLLKFLPNEMEGDNDFVKGFNNCVRTIKFNISMYELITDDRKDEMKRDYEDMKKEGQ